MELYIVRHGQTDWNKLCKFQGRVDIELNENGEEAAVKLGKRLCKEGIKFDKIFSSRYAMDSAADAGMDGIFSGRFVLVSYDPDGTCVDSGLATGFKRAKNGSDDRYTFSVTSDGDESYYKLATFTVVNNPTSNNW